MEKLQKLIDIPDIWYRRLKNTIESQQFLDLGKFIADQRSKHTIYPAQKDVFRAFKETDFNDVKVVLFGMDPYPTEYLGEPVACGLAFAPNNPEYIPPSLRIMYETIKETVYSDELTFPIDLNISNWAKQGVLLLNTGLTVQKGKAGSHIRKWEFFTNAVIETLNETTGIIFLLWGNEAKKLKPLINEKNHFILEASHPAASIYSKGPWKCDHFNRVNEILRVNHNEEIEWFDNLK